MTAPTRSHLLALLTAAATTTGLLAGCTGGTPAPDPTTEITSTAGSSPSASPTPTAVAEAPQWTDAMDQVSLDGALAVGQYFLELYPYVIETGDTTEWDRLSHPDCVFCADVGATVVETPGPRRAVGLSVDRGTGQELETGVLFTGNYLVGETHTDGTFEEVSALLLIVREGDSWLVRGVQFGDAAAANE